jgi:ribose 5-phosphate isomerase B
MKIAIGCDHAGLTLKNIVKNKFDVHDFLDCGTNSTESCDYPDFGKAVGECVALKKTDLGIVICGTGIGISIAANKVKGVRAALCLNEFMAEMSRRHNNANVLALGARVIGEELAIAIVKRWLDSPFEAGRHELRVNKISAIETESKSE